MITAKNYAGQAEKSLIEYTRIIEKRGMVEDYHWLKLYLKMIPEAQHFVVPDGGRIIDGYAKDPNFVAHMPFPAMTIEYYTSVPAKNETVGAAPKRLILVVDDKAHESMQIFCFHEVDIVNRWAPSVLGAIVPKKCYVQEGTPLPVSYYHLPYDGTCTEKLLQINIESVITSQPDLLKVAEVEFKAAGENMDQLYHELGDEVSVVLCTLEALQCSNVTYTTYQPAANNAKRRRLKVAPMYETHMLTLVTGEEKVRNTERGGGTHASPRQHLRRGHIRTYQSGKKVWVTSCVVGRSDNGVVDKTYFVK